MSNYSLTTSSSLKESELARMENNDVWKKKRVATEEEFPGKKKSR